jgi:hypothetical protein
MQLQTAGGYLSVLGQWSLDDETLGTVRLLPEPSSLALAAIGVVGAIATGIARRKRAA